MKIGFMKGGSEMLLGLMISMLQANRYVLFEDGDKIGEYRFLNDIPEVYKNAYVDYINTTINEK